MQTQTPVPLLILLHSLLILLHPLLALLLPLDLAVWGRSTGEGGDKVQGKRGEYMKRAEKEC